MKGYIDTTNKCIYIFDTEAAEITVATDGIDYIYVDQSVLLNFVNLNPNLAQLLKGYNFNSITIRPKPWKDHMNDDLEQKVSPELAWSANTATVTINADDNVYPTLTNPNSVTVAYTSSDTEKATIDAVSGVITLVAAGNTTISAVFEGNDTYEAQTVTYTLTVNAAPEPELPEVGTVYDFIGYVDDSTSTPSSTGTITYEGEYSGNTDYVYGDATVTFTGQSEAQTLTVYITKEGFITTLEGGRAQVYTLENSNFVSLGYGELTEQVP